MKIKNKKADLARPIKEVLSGLNVNESASWPAGRLNSLRSLCSMYGFMENKKYKVKQDRESQTVIVTRME